ncbi:MAG: DNA gyrase inhibitor YacG [Hahellaceae bacterium]|nr:DNA gyrase inhibitor YacG [Hahellaceae bacterium]MCP5169080.1 DNA gyrase inhibitor YacG [Hahellaceae bacterium]
MPATGIEVKCPTCQKTVIWNQASTWRPFCSKRCQLIDLGSWAEESYRIPSKNEFSSDINMDIEDDQA